MINTAFVWKVMWESRLEDIYWFDRYKTLKHFKIGSSCVNTSLPVKFTGIEAVTVGLFRNFLYSLGASLFFCPLTRNDVLSCEFSSAGSRRSRGEPHQECRVAEELLTPLNRPGRGSRESRCGPVLCHGEETWHSDTWNTLDTCNTHTNLDGKSLLNRALHRGLNGRQ